MNLHTWYTTNLYRGYPLVEGSIAIPAHVMVDASIVISGSHLPPLYIGRVTKTGPAVSLTVTDAEGAVLATASGVIAEDFQPVQLDGVGVAGYITLGKISGENFDIALPAGAAEIDLRCHRFAPVSVTSISTQNTLTGELLRTSGNLRLTSGSGIRLTVDVEAGKVTIGSALVASCPVRPILTVNNVYPDESGTLTLVADSGLSSSFSNGEIIIDAVARDGSLRKPCCECAAATDMLKDARRLLRQLMSLERDAANLASTLSDEPLEIATDCTPCAAPDEVT